MPTNDGRTRVAVLFGGRSSEHAISCATAGGVLAAIDRERFEVVPIGITRDGAWVLEDDDAAKFALDRSKLPEVADNGTRVHLPSSALHRELTVSYLSSAPGYDAPVRASGGRSTSGNTRAAVAEALAETTARRSLGDIDVVLPLLHGPFGEDGTIQGALELLDLPFVGSSVLAAAVAMDKHYTKIVLRDAGLRVADGFTVYDRDWRDDAAAVRERTATELGFPVFVKPARAGSSVGVSKVSGLDDLDEAMIVALAEDNHVLIEGAVAGREVEVAVLESRPSERARASVAGEIVMTTAEFYDFATKYLDEPGADLVCPADLTDAQLAEMQGLAIRAFEALGCQGLARVDFFLGENGFTVNEVNTMPGFTPISMFPKCWQASGMSYAELITELLEVALEHAQLRRR